MAVITTVQEILVGEVHTFGPNGEPSAYVKSPVDGPVAVGRTGLAGDHQADLQSHGGPDKAILHYAFEHYADWRAEKQELAGRLATAGAFGENLSTVGMTESELCIGDRLRIGTALVEISQARQPCWKLGHSFGDKEMVREVIRTRRSGWYYRVLENGTIATGDKIELVGRPHEEWPLDRVFGILVGGDRDPDAIAELCELKVLATSWLQRVRRLRANTLTQ